MLERQSTLCLVHCGAGTAGCSCAATVIDAGLLISAELFSAGPPPSVLFSPSHRAGL